MKFILRVFSDAAPFHIQTVEDIFEQLNNIGKGRIELFIQFFQIKDLINLQHSLILCYTVPCSYFPLDLVRQSVDIINYLDVFIPPLRHKGEHLS